jgi:hypothetical protein
MITKEKEEIYGIIDNTSSGVLVGWIVAALLVVALVYFFMNGTSTTTVRETNTIQDFSVPQAAPPQPVIIHDTAPSTPAPEPAPSTNSSETGSSAAPQ